VAVCKNLHVVKMPKRGRSKKVTQAIAEERAMKRIDRAVSRYGAGAVSKYYTSPRSAFRPEIKYFDCLYSADVDATSANWGSAVIAMTSYMNADGSTISAYTGAAIIPSAIGNGYGQIVGNKYVIKKLKTRGYLSLSKFTAATTLVEPIVVRILMIQDTQPNGAQLDLSTVFTDWGAQRENVMSYQSISAGTGGRVRILGDRTVVLQPTTAVSQSGAASSVSGAIQTREFKFTKTWKKGLKVVVKSGASTPAVASLSDCNIFLAAISYNPGNAASIIGAVRMAGVTRCSYMD